MASYVHHHMSVENVFRVAALSVFLMFIAVVLFFKEPRRSNEAQAASLGEAARNFATVLRNPKFMLFLLIFSGYWIVYWQEFIILPLYVHNYMNSEDRYGADAGDRAADGDCAADVCELADAKDSGVSRDHASAR